jgi:hypothetical protein
VAAVPVLSLLPVLTDWWGLAALRSVRGGGLLSAGVPEDMALGSLRGISALSRGAASVVSGSDGRRGPGTS